MNKNPGIFEELKVKNTAYPPIFFNQPTCFILTWLKFANIFGFSPFYVVTVYGIYEARKYKRTKVYSFIICFLSLFVYTTALRTSFNNPSRENPVTFFKLFRSTFSLIYKLQVVKTLWMNENIILQIVQFIDNCPYLSQCRLPKLLASKRKIYGVLILYTLVGVMYGLLGTSEASCSDGETVITTENRTQAEFISTAIYTFYHRVFTLLIDSHYLLFQSFPCDRLLSDMNFLNYACLFIGVTSFCYRFILGFFADLMILSWVLTLYFPTVSFIKTLHFPSNGIPRQVEIERADDITNHYKSLRILSKKINLVIGVPFLLYVLEAIFAYPVNFHDLVWSHTMLQRLLLLLFYCTTISILICSAEICRRMQSLRNWLFETGRQTDLTTNDIVLMLDDLGQNSVGMSASGVFTLNYYFVGTVTSIVLTYFIIRLQWNVVQTGMISEDSPNSV